MQLKEAFTSTHPSVGGFVGAGLTGSSPVAGDRNGRTVVQIRGLTKRFHARKRWRDMLLHPMRPAERLTVVDRVSIDIVSGELFGLLGPNGAGKTTLLKMLSTLIEPDEGTALIAGADLRSEPTAVRRAVSSVIADERSLNWRLSANENLRFYGALYGLNGAELRSRVGLTLSLVGLETTGSKLVGSFSSGMKQRLLIARALLAQPAVLLLDEPTRSLDPIAARELRAFLKEEIALKQRCTILLATHNPEEGLELCDRIAVLDRGRLIAAGSPSKLMRGFNAGRYRVWTRDPRHPALLSFAPMDSAPSRNGHDHPEWSAVDIEIGEGEATAENVLRSLVEDGVRVARFERVTLSIADFIQKLLHAEEARSAQRLS